MKAVLPGKPESRLQALATGYWESRRVTAYVSGNAFSILSDPDTILQTIYDDNEEALESIAFNEANGKIVVCTSRQVRVYKPFGLEQDALKWALQSFFNVDRVPNIHTEGVPLPSVALSWGRSEELLVAHSLLELYETSSRPECIWRKRLANAARIATLSYDSAYAATAGQYDRLVKVWRRLTFSSDEVRFDVTYLPHPDLVTSVQWRRPHYIDSAVENVLYTFCADNILRVWAASNSHGQQHPQLWGKIDISIPSPGRALETKRRKNRYWAFMIHGRDLSAATETAVQEGSNGSDEDTAALRNLIAVANRNPEVCVVLDGHGSMSAWALENIGMKDKKADMVNIARVTTAEFNFLDGLPVSLSSHVEAYSYSNKGGRLHVLLHSFDGRIRVYETNMARFFYPNSNSGRLVRKHVWTGHCASIKKIVRSFTGRAIVSRTEKGQSIVWRHGLSEQQTTLSREAMMQVPGKIHRMCILKKGRFVVFLQHEIISLWDCRPSAPLLLVECDYQVRGRPLCLLILPRLKSDDETVAHIATVTSEKQGIVWKFKLPYRPAGEDATLVHGTGASDNGLPVGFIDEFARFQLEDAGDLAYVLPVDPAGSTPYISGFLDVFARDIAVSYTHSGRVEFWTARVDQDTRQVEWLSTSSMETGVRSPSLASGSTMKTVALVNTARSKLTIWDIRGGRLEYAQDYENHDTIQDLDWTSTPDSQSILAVGFPHRVLLLAQMRFDYLNKGPAWAPIREIGIRDSTPHPIGDSTWLGDGYLVIGAGNQFIVHDRQFDASSSLVATLRLPQRKDGNWDLFDVVQRLNGPLPVFHPQFLSQCILAGKTRLVHRVLTALNKTLKFWIEGEPMDDYLGMRMDDFYTGEDARTTGDYFDDRSAYDDGEETFREDIAAAINERLTSIGLPQLSGHEQIQLVDIVECIGMVEKQRRSLDENGARFMLFYRQYSLRRRRTNEKHMSWREINWAYHSGSQDILLGFVSRQNQGVVLWEDARDSGMFMWLADEAAVRKQLEIIARNEYSKNEEKNPVDCSLYYLALRKKTVLQGLWRMASWNREQGATQRLLANNFEEPKWRTAALKNAYALISKRRFAYAAAFFLLANHLQDAVNVCLNQLKDMQLAIVIARAYEGDQGPVLRKLLEDEVLTVAAQEGNRWLASWAFWLLQRRDMAVRALITPVYTLIETPAETGLKSKSFRTDDPALVILYSQLRAKTLQTLRGASKVTPKAEWEFVLHSARLYDRMGCDLLGLDLVRNWEFLRSSASIPPGLGGEINPLQLLRRRSSLVVVDMPVPTSPVSTKTRNDFRAGGEYREHPRQTVFEEPDVNSLLDSFGF